MSSDWFSGNPAVNLEAQKVAGVSSSAAVLAHEAAGDTYKADGNSGSAKTLTFADGPVQQVVLSASGPTLTITGMTAGKAARLRLLLKQDATGSRLVPTFVPAANWGATGAPTLSTAANKTDIVDLISVDGGATLLAVLVAKGF